MHAASLDYLFSINTNGRIDACRRFFKAQCLLYKDNKEMILKEICNSNERTIRKNLNEMNHYSLLGIFDGDIIIGIWKALGKRNLKNIV
jgi:hypothetical protein